MTPYRGGSALDSVPYLFYCAKKTKLDPVMDWNKAIEINRDALTRIVAALVSLLAAQAGAARLALPVYQLIARVLLPAEAAVRRLIVIMARGVVVPVLPARPMPKGLVIVGKGTHRSFPLFDARKQFSDDDCEAAQSMTGPRIRSVGDQSPRAQFLAQFARPTDSLSSEAETAHIGRRLMTLKRALDTLPRQVKRMARWQAKRTLMQMPKFTSPLRPGPPPGHRKRPREDIDTVLTECHALAWDALHLNTS